MADIDYDEHGGPPRFTGGQVQRLINLGGALASVALIMGLCVWGYRLAVRDVSGVPVMLAIEGPMRVAPQSPGGSIADHQGMAINVIAEIGGAEALPDEIVLAPAPAALSFEDVAGLATPQPLPAPALDPSGPGPMPLEAVSLAPVEVSVAQMDQGMALRDAAALEMPTVSGTDAAVAMALADALGMDTEPLLGEDVDLASLVPETTANDPASAEGQARTQRPRARPQDMRVMTAETVSGVSVQSTALGSEIDPDSLTRGTRLVQLGAFDSADLARDEWTRTAARFGDLMTGKAPVVQAAESGGRTFYRLRAHGFATEDDVRRFCAALVAENAACIPATVR